MEGGGRAEVNQEDAEGRITRAHSETPGCAVKPWALPVSLGRTQRSGRLDLIPKRVINLAEVVQYPSLILREDSRSLVYALAHAHAGLDVDGDLHVMLLEFNRKADDVADELGVLPNHGPADSVVGESLHESRQGHLGLTTGQDLPLAAMLPAAEGHLHLRQ